MFLPKMSFSLMQFIFILPVYLYSILLPFPVLPSVPAHLFLLSLSFLPAASDPFCLASMFQSHPVQSSHE